MSKRILLVEDDYSSRLAASIILKSAGYLTTEAESAVQALDLDIKSDSFDLILTDMMMPGMTGIQFIRQLKEKGITTPTCVISAYLDNNSLQEIKELNCPDYLEKPVDTHSLLGKVSQIFRRKERA